MGMARLANQRVETAMGAARPWPWKSNAPTITDQLAEKTGRPIGDRAEVKF